MTQRKYQVFISSTYEDLKSERKAVEETIIRAGDFPVGMEAFPAADEEQFEFIKTVILSCDYYVLIIAGRYGTVASDGLSYTEKEFRFAVENKVPTLVFIHADREGLPVGKSERTQASKGKLEAFINYASQGRVRKIWASLDGLKLAVREALDHAKATKPRAGWVRGDGVTPLAALHEIEVLRLENARLSAEAGQSTNKIKILAAPSPDMKVQVLLKTDTPSYENVIVSGTYSALCAIFLASVEPRTSRWDDEYHSYYDDDHACAKFGYIIRSSFDPFSSGSFALDAMGKMRLEAFALESAFMTEGGDEPIFTEAGKVYRRRAILNQANIRDDIEIVYGTFRKDDEIPF